MNRHARSLSPELHPLVDSVVLRGVGYYMTKCLKPRSDNAVNLGVRTGIGCRMVTRLELVKLLNWWSI